MSPAWEAAIRTGDSARLAELRAGGEDIDQLDRYGQSGLMLAALLGHDRSTVWLIEQGAELDHTAKFGLSALMLAALNGHATIVRALIAGGADRELRGTGAGFTGTTALDLARTAGHHEVAALLEAASD